MQTLRETWAASAREYRHLRTLTLVAMLVALNIILDYVGSVQVLPELRVGFGFLTMAMVGMLFGPAVGMGAGCLTEVVSYLMNPRGAYFPGFTITAVVGGLIYGCVLYRQNVTYWRALLAKGLVNLIGNVLLNTIWLSMLYGDAFTALLPLRLLKNAALCPLEALMLFVVAGLVRRVAIGMGLWREQDGRIVQP